VQLFRFRPPKLAIDTDHLAREGWMRVPGAVPLALCRRLVAAMAADGVPIGDPARWPEYGAWMRDFVPIWGHQAQWDIRQLPQIHAIWAKLHGREDLYVSLDSCRFTPPWREGHAEPYGIHWEQDPNRAERRMFQGVVALTDTASDQGGFRCVPSLFRDAAAWPRAPKIDANGDEDWLADCDGREIVYVPAHAGDLIVWDSRLPHGNSKNLSPRPRLAFYLQMFPVYAAYPAIAAESWRTGRCVPFWSARAGYNRVEPWPPAKLSPLGRRLIGLDPWPSSTPPRGGAA